MKAIIKYPVIEHNIINLLAEAISDVGLMYSCKDLLIAGIDKNLEMEIAIMKSIQVLRQSGMQPQQHFKHFFVTSIETGEIYDDWHMSKMGFLLVLMHASGSSPLLNKLKIEMVKLLKL